MRPRTILLAVMAAMTGSVVGISESIAATIRNFGWHMQEFNLGMMTALMSNLDATSIGTTCVESAIDTSDELYLLLDFSLYITDGFNFGVFMNSINVVFVKLMQQFEDCGVNELFIQWDNIMSHISDICGVVVNLAIAVGVGWANRDTFPYIVYDEHWVPGW